MSKMKRIVVLLMVAMMVLAQTASAAAPNLSITQVRDEAAAGWHETFDGPMGPVAVDIDIQVPEVEAAPVVEADWIHRINPSLIPLAPDYYAQDEVVPPGIVASTDKDFLTVLPDNVGANPVPLFAEQIDWDAPFMEENPTSLNEIIDTVKSDLRSLGFADTDFEWERPFELYSIRYRKGSASKGIYDGEPFHDMGHCSFTARQKFHGIPVLADVRTAFVDNKAKTGEQYGSSLSLLVSAKSNTEYIYAGHLVGISSTSHPDIPLCSVEKVKSAIVPYIERGHVRDILSFELGYVSYRTTGELFGPLELVPTWVIGCRYYPDARQETIEYQLSEDHVRTSGRYSELLVNAQTGEIIDPDSSASDRSMAPAIISW